MKLKINLIYITFFLFISFFFLWRIDFSIDLGDFPLLDRFDFLKENIPVSDGKFQILAVCKYFILLLVFPIFFNLFKEIESISINKVFNSQKYIILLVSFVVLHFFLTKFINNQIIENTELYKLFLFILLSIIFTHYRIFLKNHFENILFLFLIIFVFFAFYPNDYNYVVGQCNNEIFLFYFIENNFNFFISSGIFLENSHLAMMMVAVIFSIIFIITKSKKINFIYIFLFFLSTLVIVLNYSVTFFVCYVISFITIVIFLHSKISIKFWIFSLLFLSFNAIFFLTDNNCIKKISDISLKDVAEKKISKSDRATAVNPYSKNLTTLIYERSAILTLDTLRYYPFGWGFDGMDNATTNLISKDRYTSREVFIGDGSTMIFDLKNEVYDTSESNFVVSLDASDSDVICNKLGFIQIKGIEKDFTIAADKNNKMKRIIFTTAPMSGVKICVIKDVYVLAKVLNLNDGLSNFFKILNEFGIFSLFILYFFIRYLLKLEKIETYHLFIVIIFITMSIRGAGYFNGAFIFCLLEFFYIQKLDDKKKILY